MLVSVRELTELTGISRQKIEKIIKQNSLAEVQGCINPRKYKSADALPLLYSDNYSGSDYGCYDSISDEKKVEEIKTIKVKREILLEKYILRSDHDQELSECFKLLRNFVLALKSQILKSIPNKTIANLSVDAIDNFIQSYCEQFKSS